MLLNDTGLGRNPVTNALDATPEWWRKKFSTEEAEEEDVYRLTMDEEERLGDNEYDTFRVHPEPSTGVTDKSGPFILTDSGNQGKRKKLDRAAKRKKLKTPVAKQITDAISVIANTSMERAVAISNIRQRSVDIVIKDLFALEEVQDDCAFRIRYIHLLTVDRSSRDTFAFLHKENK